MIFCTSILGVPEPDVFSFMFILGLPEPDVFSFMFSLIISEEQLIRQQRPTVEFMDDESRKAFLDCSTWQSLTSCSFLFPSAAPMFFFVPLGCSRFVEAVKKVTDQEIEDAS